MPRKRTDKPETADVAKDSTVPSARTRKSGSATQPSALTSPVARESASLTTNADAPRPAFAVASTMVAGGASEVSENERIAKLAYHYWEARGRQGGSPLEDWLRAEREIRNRPRP